MELDEKDLNFLNIFLPEILPEYEFASQKGRFAYYTSADTAFKILEHAELWLRNATVMNDFMEISYGLELVDFAFDVGQVSGEKFRSVVKSIFPNALSRIDELYQGWKRDWVRETYISCISAHDPSEDQYGRLSMWRAYGDIALIINNTPLMQVTDVLGVYSSPVIYVSHDTFRSRLLKIARKIEENQNYLSGLGEDEFVARVQHFLMMTALCSKYPGFLEEREWRVFYRPTTHPSPLIKEKIVVKNGVAQRIFTLPLIHSPENGLFGADIPSLLDRLIVGPTEYSYVVSRAFIALLERAGVTDAAKKVVISDIPLRVHD